MAEKVPRKFECSERWQQSWKSVEILYKNHSKMVKRSLGRTDEQIKPARNVWTSRLETRSTNQVAALTRASEKVKFSSIKYEQHTRNGSQNAFDKPYLFLSQTWPRLLWTASNCPRRRGVISKLNVMSKPLSLEYKQDNSQLLYT